MKTLRDTARRLRSDRVTRVAAACHSAATGLELCARRTRDGSIAVAARSAAEVARSLHAAIVQAASGRSIDARPRHRTSERLRWEWLASTATVVDGTPEMRLLAECAHVLSEALEHCRAGDLGKELALRFRLASAEAFSLSLAVHPARELDLLLATA